MDYELLRQASQEMRDKHLRRELGMEKCMILDKYNLKSNTNLYWERWKDHYPTQKYFSHRFAKKASTIGMLFHIYRLCYAKVKYFEQNWTDFGAYIYNWQTGSFEPTELYNMEFIKHLSSGIIFDLRKIGKN